MPCLKTKKKVVGKYTEGFGALPRSAIVQHLRARDPEKDLVEVIEKRVPSPWTRD